MTYDARITATDAGYEFNGMTDDRGERLQNRTTTQLLSEFSDGRGSELQQHVAGGTVRTRPFLTTLISLFCRQVVDQLAAFAQEVSLSSCELVAYRQLSVRAVVVTLRLAGGGTDVTQTLELGDGD